MRKQLRNYCLLALITGLAASCGPKAPSVPAAKMSENTVETLKNAKLTLYPKAEFLDESFKRSMEPDPGPEVGKKFTEVMVTRAWLATNDSPEKVEAFYAKEHPYTITRETDGEDVFVQLSSVKDIAVAINQERPMINLVDIRTQKLSSGERSAYQNELDKLKALDAPDLIQRKRIQELKRYLSKDTLIKLSVRRENPHFAPDNA